VFEDISNKTPEEASDLPRTEKFIRDHLGVSELDGSTLHIIYNFGYTHLKYLNQKVTLNTSEKKASKSAKEDPWSFAMERVMNDRQHKRDFTVIKNRFAELLSSCAGFEPL
jgi:hypothetical protein